MTMKNKCNLLLLSQIKLHTFRYLSRKRQVPLKIWHSYTVVSLQNNLINMNKCGLLQSDMQVNADGSGNFWIALESLILNIVDSKF